MLTSEQVIALAPDASSVKSGKDLAVTRKWVTLGNDEHAAWGQVQGSGKLPYQTQVDLGAMAFKCSCPSRKFPCKHGIGLLLLLAEQGAAFTETEQPAWVAEWLMARAGRAEKARETATVSATKAADPAAQEKRAQSREKKVAAGLQELQTWMHDLMRGGLAAAQGRPYSYWDGMSARLVDAQAPGAARMVREMAGTVATGAAQQSELLWHLGRLHLLVRGYERIASLPPDLQAEIRTQIGWTQNQEELLTQPGLHDSWMVLGSSVVEEDRLRIGRTYLCGRYSGRTALVLQFAHGSSPLAISLLPGTEFDGELVFFPGTVPLRAVVKEPSGEVRPIADVPAKLTIREATQRYTEGLALNPWLPSIPVALGSVVPVPHDSGDFWILHDAVEETDSNDKRQAFKMRLASNFEGAWKLLALSGGRPVQLFGEWNGQDLLPFGAVVESRWCKL